MKTTTKVDLGLRGFKVFCVFFFRVFGFVGPLGLLGV